MKIHEKIDTKKELLFTLEMITHRNMLYSIRFSRTKTLRKKKKYLQIMQELDAKKNEVIVKYLNS
jgi:ribosomal protein S24E